MKIALDPYMLRDPAARAARGSSAELGYEYIELSPRRTSSRSSSTRAPTGATIAAFRRALDAAGVRARLGPAALPLVGPDEDERQAAVRYWKRAIEIAVDLGCRR